MVRWDRQLKISKQSTVKFLPRPGRTPALPSRSAHSLSKNHRIQAGVDQCNDKEPQHPSCKKRNRVNAAGPKIADQDRKAISEEHVQHDAALVRKENADQDLCDPADDVAARYPGVGFQIEEKEIVHQ